MENKDTKSHVIVIGNEKGGSGKTTTAMHIVVALLRAGFSVACVDLDSRQKSFSKYIENRKNSMARKGILLPCPEIFVIERSKLDKISEAAADEKERFEGLISAIQSKFDFVIIDSPGSDTPLSRAAHSCADTVVTPINDSFVDLDVLAHIDPVKMQVIKPNIYSEMVWQQKIEKAGRDGGSIDWVVMRNRLSNIAARNKKNVEKVIAELSKRVGFRLVPGFSERVIFRELFLEGLTVLDVLEEKLGISISMSHIAARQEVRNLLKSLNLSGVTEKLESSPLKKRSNPVKAENKNQELQNA